MPDAALEDDAGVLEGRNAVIEALRAGRPIDKIFLSAGETDGALGHIAATARAAGTVVVEADKRKLDAMSKTGAHQGVVAVMSAAVYVTVDDILSRANSLGQTPLIVVCDEISDPHNLGAIIRTAECAGAHGVIIPKRRSAGLTAIVSKTSAGAVAHLPVARVSNITAALQDLKKAGLWVYGTAADGQSGLWQTDLTGPTALVIGSEGKGLSRLVAETCDFTVSIPMTGKIASLNASVSAAVVLYEALRQRQTAAESN
ncbi:23S rRNA (guanosine(2251)-2'-O)-methyltransferase RlmB [Oscillospiraceae bacterium CM]|nr:23S rRNA (guanosine(2251)-2'-O)-methyltransferase RlmB [Oscillospiraceae bacterium CM]